MARTGKLGALVGAEALEICGQLGVARELLDARDGLEVRSPITGEIITLVRQTSDDGRERAIGQAISAFDTWRCVPPPRRGELVRRFADALRANKALLAQLVTLESGKVVSEGLGEVQEMIDICEFAAGLSRQLHGVTIASERPHHRMMETWHPLGPVAIISAFNFPVAVWSWNAALALVCGSSCIWKPSEKGVLAALATQAVFERVRCSFPEAPEGLSTVVIGGGEAGAALAADRRLPLVSATGSTAMGRKVGHAVATRLGRSLLELGGNNGAIVAPSADAALALRAVAFAAMGTAGQRCTTLRRLFVHTSIYAAFVERLKAVYGSVMVGDPRDPATLVGPLIDRHAFDQMEAAIQAAMQDGAQITGGGRLLAEQAPDAFYAAPAVVEIASQTDIVRCETFAPLLYVMAYDTLEEAIALNNGVAQGLSSAIFTTDLREAELFLSVAGSDCGIANVNIGPSGAEIGGAFGGEKDTGGGREAGSDAWKAYMRRATNTINYGNELPLSQGVRFDVEA